MSSLEQNDDDKRYCANCIHCKTVRVPLGDGRNYQLRIRCEAGQWKKKLGEEKLHKYFTVSRRDASECPCYETMGDSEEFIRELKKTLPIKDEVYSPTNS